MIISIIDDVENEAEMLRHDLISIWQSILKLPSYLTRDIGMKLAMAIDAGYLVDELWNNIELQQMAYPLYRRKYKHDELAWLDVSACSCCNKLLAYRSFPFSKMTTMKCHTVHQRAKCIISRRRLTNDIEPTLTVTHAAAMYTVSRN